jgi:hypothetical protein
MLITKAILDFRDVIMCQCTHINLINVCKNRTTFPTQSSQSIHRLNSIRIRTCTQNFTEIGLQCGKYGQKFIDKSPPPGARNQASILLDQFL